MKMKGNKAERMHPNDLLAATAKRTAVYRGINTEIRQLENAKRELMK